jgi:Na+/melibiose symporter-like transporter
LSSFAGYVSRGCYQPESVILTLKVLVSPVPVALIAIGLLILKTYPIDEEKRKSNRKLLQELRYGNGPGLTSPSRLYT